jgi:hypothetical protein
MDLNISVPRLRLVETRTRASPGYARLIAEGSEAGGVAPELFAEHIRREIARWAEVVKVSGYTPE